MSSSRGQKLTILATLAAATVGLAGAAGPSADRVDAARVAASKFLELNFFAEGGGMHLSPGLLKFSDDIEIAPLRNPSEKIRHRAFTHRWGINWLPPEPGEKGLGKPVGLFNLPYKGMTVGVLGCVACHSGKAAGQFVVGLGNKNIDVYAIGRDAYLAERVWKQWGKTHGKTEEYRQVEDSALEFAKTLSHPEYTNLTQGMVPTSVIRSWFYREAGKPFPKGVRAAVKVPSLWGYGEKKKVGQFCDGIGDGNYPGWGIAVELTANQKVEVVRGYLDKIGEAEEFLGNLLPPKYPRAIDSVRAERGRARFEKTCAHCHGTYEFDSAGLPIVKAPEFIPWENVRTDRDRLNGNTPEFISLVKTNPLNDVIRTTEKGNGYFAPRLNGIWARFPYLHNGSVPTIEALLSPPSERPRVFDLERAGEAERFDEHALGLTLPAKGSHDEARLLRQGKRGKRNVYFTDRPGHSSQGHDFYTDMTEEERLDVIEYLKTL